MLITNVKNEGYYRVGVLLGADELNLIRKALYAYCQAEKPSQYLKEFEQQWNIVTDIACEGMLTRATLDLIRGKENNEDDLASLS